MKILKLKLFQEVATYKKPYALKVEEVYPLPPYSTVIGFLHNILEVKNGEKFNFNVSILCYKIKICFWSKEKRI